MATSAEKVLADAQGEYFNHHYSKSIEAARSAIHVSPLRAWRLIGSAACGRNDLKLAKESYLNLDAVGRQYLLFNCQRSGINLESLIGPGKH